MWKIDFQSVGESNRTKKIDEEITERKCERGKEKKKQKKRIKISTNANGICMQRSDMERKRNRNIDEKHQNINVTSAVNRRVFTVLFLFDVTDSRRWKIVSPTCSQTDTHV